MFGQDGAETIAEHRREFSQEVDRFTVAIRVQPNESDCGQFVAEWDIAGPVGRLEHTHGLIDVLCDRILTRLRLAFDKPLRTAVEALENEAANDDDSAAPTPCTLNLRDAANAPEPYIRQYDEIEKYRKSESPNSAVRKSASCKSGLRSDRKTVTGPSFTGNGYAARAARSSGLSSTLTPWRASSRAAVWRPMATRRPTRDRPRAPSRK